MTAVIVVQDLSFTMLAGHGASLLPIRFSGGRALRQRRPACYGSRLRFLAVSPGLISSSSSYSNRTARQFTSNLFAKLLIGLTLASAALAQVNIHALKADLPPEDEIRFHGMTQDSNGSMRYLHKPASIETSEMVISADEIRYDSDTAWAYAQGHVHMEHYLTGDKVNADRAEYNLKSQARRLY